MSLAVDERAGIPPAERESLWAAAGGWRGVGVAVGILALTRVGQMLMLAWLHAAADTGRSMREELLRWDAGFFVRLAEYGYPSTYTYDQSGNLIDQGLAFFPVYPMVIRVVTVFGLDPGTAAIAVGWLASVALGVTLHLLGTTLYGRRAGWALVAICCSAPASVVFSMAYSETLFLALAAGSLAAAHRGAWGAAGLLGFLAALTRPTGAAVGVALAVAAVLAVRRSRERAWQPLGAAALALAGVPLFLGFVGLRMGDPMAWFYVQSEGYGTAFDFGASTLAFLKTALSTGDGWIQVSVALLLLAALAAAGVALAGRPWPPIAVYGVLAMVLVYGQAGFYHSKPRLLVPVLLTLLPAVVAAARARTRVAVLSITAWAAFGLWYGAYLVAVWPYTL